MANHEAIYRGKKTMDLIAKQKLVLFGAGAVGSLLADHVTRIGFRDLVVFDKDRVDKDNIYSQIYGLKEQGQLKVAALQARIFLNLQVKIEAVTETITSGNISKIVKKYPGAIFIDCFDNTASRQILFDNVENCLHIGLGGNYCEVVWNHEYKVPQDGGLDVCEYPQARSLTSVAIALATETIIDYLETKERKSRCFTLKDFKTSAY